MQEVWVQYLVRELDSICHNLSLPGSAKLINRASQVVLVVKNPLANAGEQEMWIRSLGWEDPLEKRMATCSSILAWEIPWTEEPGKLQSMGSKRVGHD